MEKDKFIKILIEIKNNNKEDYEKIVYEIKKLRQIR
ncbi:hypothetical protein TPHSE_16950 [Terrisporobacter petrolearius]